MQGTSRSELAAALDRCARHCEDTAALYAERGDGGRPTTEVVSGLLLAAAAMDTAARVAEDDGAAATTALLIAETLVRDAIDAAERHGLDETLLHCVADLRQVEKLLDE